MRAKDRVEGCKLTLRPRMKHACMHKVSTRRRSKKRLELSKKQVTVARQAESCLKVILGLSMTPSVIDHESVEV